MEKTAACSGELDSDQVFCQTLFPGLEWLAMPPETVRKFGAIKGLQCTPLRIEENQPAIAIFLLAYPESVGCAAFASLNGGVSLQETGHRDLPTALSRLKLDLDQCSEFVEWMKIATTSAESQLRICRLLIPGMTWVALAEGAVRLKGEETTLPIAETDCLTVEVMQTDTGCFVPRLVAGDTVILSDIVDIDLAIALRHLLSTCRSMPSLFRRLKQSLPHSRVPNNPTQFRRSALERLLCASDSTEWVDEHINDCQEIIALYDLCALGVCVCFDLDFNAGRRGFRILPSQLENAQRLLAELYQQS